MARFLNFLLNKNRTDLKITKISYSGLTNKEAFILKVLNMMKFQKQKIVKSNSISTPYEQIKCYIESV